MKNNYRLDQLKKLSTLLDSQFTGPLGFKYGIDAIVGLIPFVGDFITTSLSLYIVAQAASLGCSTSVMLRMGFNIILENIVDLIPVLGWLFDFVWKSNDKNITLLESHLENPRKATIQSQIILGLVCLTVMSFLLGSIYFTIFIFEKIMTWISVFSS